MDRPPMILLLLYFILSHCSAQDCIEEEIPVPDTKYKVRLVGGNGDNEGNIELNFEGEWAGICDDDWGIEDATVVCKQLGYTKGALRSTTGSHFGPGKVGRRTVMWMDNVACKGHESEISLCKSNGMAVHDCTRMEAAGVICRINPPLCKSNKLVLRDPPPPKQPIRSIFTTPVKITFADGRNTNEGRVLIFAGNTATPMGEVCGNGWGVKEAMVACKHMNMGFAQQAVRTDFFGAVRNGATNNLPIVLSGVKCTGEENNLNECQADPLDLISCETDNDDRSVAGVVCVADLPDLMPDLEVLQSSVYLSDVPMLYLQCALEENCLASTVNNHPFRPHAPKNGWEWHQCHMHYHSMEEFSHYDIIDEFGVRQAEGHKASFCLEDNACAFGYFQNYACVNFGDQGISPGCYDEYKHDIDCQWIDITDMPPGQYIFKMAINPHYKVSELNFTNNAIHCSLYYSQTQAILSDCYYLAP